MINELLAQRNLPELLRLQNGEAVTKDNWDARRAQLIALLTSEEYGTLPPPPATLEFKAQSEEKTFCAGKATLLKTEISCGYADGKTFRFPVYSVIPHAEKLLPSFILINFRPDVPDRYLPSEELCDLGYAVHSFCYADISSDDEDYENGLAALFCGKEKNTERGKIALWAYAASRVLDFALTLPGTDPERIAVVGHSRLGKTALLCGGLDERFSAVISNDSGCSGAALSRNKQGETVGAITDRFPHWFKDSYKQYADNESAMTIDQHFLLALTAPRKLFISSAALDNWADPDSEFLAAAAASPAFELLGVKGLVHKDTIPNENELLGEGNVGYRRRTGTHYLSRSDWKAFCAFQNEKRIMNENN